MNMRITLRLLADLRRLRERDHWTREQLAAHQANALRSLREHAYAHSPFYQRFHKGLTDRPLQELPVLTKAMLMDGFDELVTDRTIRREEVEAHVANLHGDERFRSRYWVNVTSGSTGRRGLFLFDHSEWAMVLASFARTHEWTGLEVSLTHRMRMASVASTIPWYMSARVAATLRSWWMPVLRLDAMEPVETIIERLNTWQPEILVAYPSLARVLADEQIAGHLAIRPSLIFTSSEVLTVETRRRVEQAWGMQPFNQYGATETGGLAAECTQHCGMHLAEDLVIPEVVDKDNRPVPAGTYGDKLLVTVLFSRTQPLIRYELSDSVRLASAPCPCGRPFALIEDIQGRMEDVLYLSAATGGEVAVHPRAVRRIMDVVPAAAWQVVQEHNRLTVLLAGVRDGFADMPLIDALQRALVDQGASTPVVHVQRVPAIPKGPTGKSPFICSNLSSRTSRAPTPIAPQ